MYILTKNTAVTFTLCISFALSSAAQDLRIDHVIAFFNDLDSVTNHYQQLGFTIKKGRLHKNGLLNAHINLQIKQNLN